MASAWVLLHIIYVYNSSVLLDLQYDIIKLEWLHLPTLILAVIMTNPVISYYKNDLIAIHFLWSLL